MFGTIGLGVPVEMSHRTEPLSKGMSANFRFVMPGPLDLTAIS